MPWLLRLPRRDGSRWFQAMVARFEHEMAWIEDEILRQGAARIVSHRGWFQPLSRRHRFQFDNGLYVTTIMGVDASLVFQFTLMGRADGTIATPGVGEHAKFERAIRGYRRRLLERSRKPINGLPPDIARRLAEVAGALSNPAWWLFFFECTEPRLLERGFPAWRITCINLGGPRLHLLREVDYPGFAGRMLSQVDEMRRLLEDIRKWASIAVPEPR